MNHPVTYFGYREYEKIRLFRPIIIPGRTLGKFRVPSGRKKVEAVALRWFHWDLLGPIPYDYEVFSGEAGDNYTDDYTYTDFQTRAIFCTIRDNPAMIIFTYDGINDLPERQFDMGFTRVESVRGFKIRNAYTEMISRYQVIALR